MENLVVVLRRLNNLFFIIFLSLNSCIENNDEAQKVVFNSITINYSEINFESIYKVKNSKFVDQWINYFELNQIIEQLNNEDYSSLVDNKKYLLRFFNGIKKTIPNNINNSEIKSRLTVIETDFLKFESKLSSYEIEDKTKTKMVKKINNSFSNLNFQIDKLLEKQEINLD